MSTGLRVRRYGWDFKSISILGCNMKEPSKIICYPSNLQNFNFIDSYSSQKHVILSASVGHIIFAFKLIYMLKLVGVDWHLLIH